MKRKIIKIDDDLCNGCGVCVTSCAEGALQIIDGKAKLVKEDFCDGLGACIGDCPTGALTIEEREANEFDEKTVKKHIASQKQTVSGEVKEKHQDSHGGHHHEGGGMCPSMKIKMPQKDEVKEPTNISENFQAIPSELSQWPVQLHLVNPSADFFKNKELVVLSTCSPIASADVHWRYLRGRSIVVACPKLDRTDPYVEKLTAILQETTIPKVIVLIMEVPCCKGLSVMVQEAVSNANRSNLKFEEHVMSLSGSIKSVKKQ